MGSSAFSNALMAAAASPSAAAQAACTSATDAAGFGALGDVRLLVVAGPLGAEEGRDLRLRLVRDRLGRDARVLAGHAQRRRRGARLDERGVERGDDRRALGERPRLGRVGAGLGHGLQRALQILGGGVRVHLEALLGLVGRVADPVGGALGVLVEVGVARRRVLVGALRVLRPRRVDGDGGERLLEGGDGRGVRLLRGLGPLVDGGALAAAGEAESEEEAGQGGAPRGVHPAGLRDVGGCVNPARHRAPAAKPAWPRAPGPRRGARSGDRGRRRPRGAGGRR